MEKFENGKNMPKKKITLNIGDVKREKNKITVYLPEDTMKKLNIMCSEKLLKYGKLDRSIIVCEAIEMLYGKGKR